MVIKNVGANNYLPLHFFTPICVFTPIRESQVLSEVSARTMWFSAA